VHGHALFFHSIITGTTKLTSKIREADRQGQKTIIIHFANTASNRFAKPHFPSRLGEGARRADEASRRTIRAKHLPPACSRRSFPSPGIATHNGDAPDPPPAHQFLPHFRGRRTSRHPGGLRHHWPTLRVTFSDPVHSHARAAKPPRQQSSAKNFCPTHAYDYPVFRSRK
jgi:hypothetical protein